jgi:hypothetical protein
LTKRPPHKRSTVCFVLVAASWTGSPPGGISTRANWLSVLIKKKQERRERKRVLHLKTGNAAIETPTNPSSVQRRGEWRPQTRKREPQRLARNPIPFHPGHGTARWRSGEVNSKPVREPAKLPVSQTCGLTKNGPGREGGWGSAVQPGFTAAVFQTTKCGLSEWNGHWYRLFPRGNGAGRRRRRLAVDAPRARGRQTPRTQAAKWRDVGKIRAFSADPLIKPSLFS